jgi:acyl-CoA thioester hydrolase
LSGPIVNAAAPPQSLPSYHTGIDPAWIDYNGHLRDAYYGLIVSYAIDDFMDHVGVDAAYRTRTRCTLYTLEMHLHYMHEVKGTDQLDVETAVLDADAKRMHVGCRLTCPRVKGALATADLLLMHVQQGDVPAGAPFPDDIAQRLQSLKLPAEASAAWGPRSHAIEIKRRARPGS